MAEIKYDHSFHESEDTVKLSKADINLLLSQDFKHRRRYIAIRVVMFVTTALGILFLFAALFHKEHKAKIIKDNDASAQDIPEIEISAEPLFIPPEEIVEAGLPKKTSVHGAASTWTHGNHDGLVMPWPDNKIKFRPKKKEKTWVK